MKKGEKINDDKLETSEPSREEINQAISLIAIIKNDENWIKQLGNYSGRIRFVAYNIVLNVMSSVGLSVSDYNEICSRNSITDDDFILIYSRLMNMDRNETLNEDNSFLSIFFLSDVLNCIDIDIDNFLKAYKKPNILIKSIILLKIIVLIKDRKLREDAVQIFKSELMQVILGNLSPAQISKLPNAITSTINAYTDY